MVVLMICSLMFGLGHYGIKIESLKARAAEASKFLKNNGSGYYKILLQQNRHHIKEPPTVENCQLLAKQLLYTRLASVPHRYQSLLEEVESVKGLWKNRKELKIEDAGIACLFGLECFAWFFAGEIIGRGFTFTGYHV